MNIINGLNIHKQDLEMIKDVISILNKHPDVVEYGNKDGWFPAWNDMKNKHGEWKPRIIPVIHVRNSGFSQMTTGSNGMDKMVQACPLLSYHLKMINYTTLDLETCLKLVIGLRKSLYTESGRAILNSLPKSRQSLLLAGLINSGMVNIKPDHNIDINKSVLDWEKTFR